MTSCATISFPRGTLLHAVSNTSLLDTLQVKYKWLSSPHSDEFKNEHGHTFLNHFMQMLITNQGITVIILT